MAGRDYWRIVGRFALGSVLFGAVPALMGARSAVEAGLVFRMGEFAFIALAGTLMSAVFLRYFPRLEIAGGRWLRALAAGVVLTTPMGLIVFGIDEIFARQKPTLHDLPGYLLVSMGVSLFFSFLGAYFSTPPIVITRTAPAAATVRFLERLPIKLRGASVWAVEAEDHYLRLHTSRGQDLILMRLADAIAELDGLEGMQVHRSWWVAREAIADIARADGRATLTLQDGSQVPVSRTFAKQLRERGWM